jgi:hypothetical protein
MTCTRRGAGPDDVVHHSTSARRRRELRSAVAPACFDFDSGGCAPRRLAGRPVVVGSRRCPSRPHCCCTQPSRTSRCTGPKRRPVALRDPQTVVGSSAPHRRVPPAIGQSVHRRGMATRSLSKTTSTAALMAPWPGMPLRCQLRRPRTTRRPRVARGGGSAVGSLSAASYGISSVLTARRGRVAGASRRSQQRCPRSRSAAVPPTRTGSLMARAGSTLACRRAAGATPHRPSCT